MAISLLPNTGVQYVELPALFTDKNLEDAKNKWSFKVKSMVVPRITLVQAPAATEPPGGQGPHEEEEEPGSRFFVSSLQPARPASPESTAAGNSTPPDTAVVTAQLSVALDMALANGGWMPIPFNAPTSGLWTLLWVSKSSKVQGTWDVVLAVDTTLTPHGAGGTLSEDSIPAQFRLEPTQQGQFWNSDPIKGWIDAYYQKLLKQEMAAGRRQNSQDPKQWRGAIQAHLAGFYHFLKDLPGATFPEINFEPDAGAVPVDISVVVDLGNSRTCCVIHEMRTLPGRRPFEALQLRDPRRPNETYSGPAQTRLAFVSPGRCPLPNDPRTFLDLSIVRYGKMAVDLLGEATGDVGARGLSSPKRYMWDDEKRSEPWQLALADPEHPRNLIHGPVLRCIDESRPFSKPTLTESEPVNPSYPRKTGALLLLIEVLEQAFRQANSAEHRGVQAEQSGWRSRRLIRSLVLMHPAGMHSDEVKQLKLAATRAAELWAEFRHNPVAFIEGNPEPPSEESGFPVPQVFQDCDEGMSIQVCYLYGETMHRYLERTDRLVGAMGRVRDGKPSVRIASIDIGGGTTDLAIADYMTPLGAVQGTYEYERLFHDGFPVGGDDLSHDILRDLVFPAIIAQMGLSVAHWNQQFGARFPVEPAWAAVRRNLVTAFWLPLVHGCLKKVEAGQDVDGLISELLTVRNQGAEQELDKRLREFARGSKSGQDGRAAPAAAGPARDGFPSVLAVRVTINRNDLLRVTRRTLGTALRQYSDIIGQHRAEVLVLGGRPSALPSVAQLINESLPVPPGATVYLHQQAVHDWFPYNDNGRVGDSKTCSVVGAALMFMAGHDYSNFILRERPDAQSVVNIHGVLRPAEMVLDSRLDLFQGNPQTSNAIRFEGEAITLGCRHINGDRAMARPTYRLVRDPYLEKKLRTHAVRNDPLLVKLSCQGAGSDVLKVSEVNGTVKFINDQGKQEVAANHLDSVRCKLQTLIESDYWLDSGCFRELPIES